MLNSKSKIFRYFLLCFIIGVAIRSFLAVDFFWVYLLALLSLTAAGFFWPKKFGRYLFLGGILISLGLWRYQLSLPQTNGDRIEFYNGQKVNFTALISDEPDARIDQTKLTVSVVSLPGHKVRGKVLVSANLYPEYRYGDLLSISCKLQAPTPFSGFAYDRYLAIKNVYAQCFYPKIELVVSGQGNFFKAGIFELKRQLVSLINGNLPEPQASLFAAIILGARRGLPAELNNQFSVTGTTHLIAISGLNIAIIITILTEFFIWLGVGRKKSFWLITSFLTFYLIIVGLPASAVRAGIMGWLMVLAMQVGRLNNSVNALILTAAIMIFINPKILRDDVGFQLSFCAILGLIYFVPYLSRRWQNLPSWFGIKESLQATLAAQLTTLPIIVYNFGRLSLIAPVANLLVVPVLPFLTIAGFLILPVGLIFNFFLPYLFWPVWLILTYLIKMVVFFSALPLAAISV